MHTTSITNVEDIVVHTQTHAHTHIYTDTHAHFNDNIPTTVWWLTWMTSSPAWIFLQRSAGDYRDRKYKTLINWSKCIDPCILVEASCATYWSLTCWKKRTLESIPSGLETKCWIYLEWDSVFYALQPLVWCEILFIDVCEKHFVFATDKAQCLAVV